MFCRAQRRAFIEDATHLEDVHLRSVAMRGGHVRANDQVFSVVQQIQFVRRTKNFRSFHDQSPGENVLQIHVKMKTII